jgi:Aspartyl protease
MKKIILFLLTLPIFTKGQNKINLNQGIIVQKEFCDTIPFKYVRNKIIIEVKINGEKKNFILDTGSTLCISDEIQGKMKNPIWGNFSPVDAYGQKRQISFIKGKELQLGSVTFRKIPSGVISTKNIDFLSCIDFDGFIGSNLLRNCILHIDIDRKEIILTNNIHKLNLKNTFKTSLILDNQSNPLLQLNLNNKLKFYGLFDSGADDFITMSNKTLNVALEKGTTKVLNQGYGVGGIGMFGVDKSEVKKRLISNNLKWGNDEISDFVTEFSSKSYDAIGMELADYGSITIDYLNKKFYFKAKQQSQPYLHKKTIGFSFQPEQDYYSIGTVWTGTQAEKIGLRNGYQILKLDSLDISTRTKTLDCQMLLTRPLRNGKIKLTYKNDMGQVKMVELNDE